MNQKEEVQDDNKKLDVKDLPNFLDEENGKEKEKKKKKEKKRKKKKKKKRRKMPVKWGGRWRKTIESSKEESSTEEALKDSTYNGEKLLGGWDWAYLWNYDFIYEHFR